MKKNWTKEDYDKGEMVSIDYEGYFYEIIDFDSVLQIVTAQKRDEDEPIRINIKNEDIIILPF